MTKTRTILFRAGARLRGSCCHVNERGKHLLTLRIYEELRRAIKERE